MKIFFRIIRVAIPFIWFGIIGAISFMEAPLKFQAPGMTLGIGLGVGRLIFWTLNKIEIVLAIFMLISLFVGRPKGSFPFLAAALIAGLLFLQTVWLLPVLDARATEVINGTVTPYSNTHFIYIAFDAIKFFLLFALGWNLIRQNLKLEQS